MDNTILITRQKLLADFKSLSFHLCRMHAKNASHTHLPIYKNINNVNPTSLRNANFDNKFSPSDATIFLDQSISHVTAETCPLLTSSFPLVVTHLAIFASVGPTTHSGHVSTIISQSTTCVRRRIVNGAKPSAVRNSITE